MHLAEVKHLCYDNCKESVPTYDALYLFVTMLNYYGLLVFLVGNGTYQSDGN